MLSRKINKNTWVRNLKVNDHTSPVFRWFSFYFFFNLKCVWFFFNLIKIQKMHKPKNHSRISSLVPPNINVFPYFLKVIAWYAKYIDKRRKLFVFKDEIWDISDTFLGGRNLWSRKKSVDVNAISSRKRAQEFYWVFTAAEFEFLRKNIKIIRNKILEVQWFLNMFLKCL